MKKLYMTIILIFVVSALTFAQTKGMLGVNVGIANPSATFGEMFSGGFGGNVSLHHPLSTSFTIYGSLGYYTFSEGDKQKEIIEIITGSNDVTVDVTANIIPIVAGFNYYLTDGKFKPYLGLELGLHMLTFSDPEVKVNGQKADVEKEDSETKFGWGIGVGFLYELSPTLSLDINAKYNGNGSKAEYNIPGESSESNIVFSTISAGVRYMW